MPCQLPVYATNGRGGKPTFFAGLLHDKYYLSNRQGNKPGKGSMLSGFSGVGLSQRTGHSKSN